MHANSVLAFWGPVSLTNTAAMSVASGSRTGEGTVLPPQEFALCYVGVLPDSLPAIPVLDLAPPPFSSNHVSMGTSLGGHRWPRAHIPGPQVGGGCSWLDISYIPPKVRCLPRIGSECHCQLRPTRKGSGEEGEVTLGQF